MYKSMNKLFELIIPELKVLTSLKPNLTKFNSAGIKGWPGYIEYFSLILRHEVIKDEKDILLTQGTKETLYKNLINFELLISIPAFIIKL